jgi:hypothetical protein
LQRFSSQPRISRARMSPSNPPQKIFHFVARFARVGTVGRKRAFPARGRRRLLEMRTL